MASRAAGGDGDLLDGQFHLAACWNNWDLKEMARDGGEFSTEVTLPHDGGEFQIVCDRDWSRVLYPAKGGGAADGPDDGGHGRNWELGGRAGDRFRIELRWPAGASGRDAPDVQWKQVGWAPHRPEHLTLAERLGLLDVSRGITETSAEGAFAQLQDWKKVGLKPDADSCGVVLKACEKDGAWENALAVFEMLWDREKEGMEPTRSDYEAVARVCRKAGQEEEAEGIEFELSEWGEGTEVDRFQLTPRVHWNRQARRLGCAARNTLHWQGGEPVPEAPRACWMLPASDTVANEIAEWQDQLREAGWKVIAPKPEIVERLDNKASFQRYAESLGLADHLPKAYTSAEAAEYPCILKPAAGEFGAAVRIVHSADEVLEITDRDGAADVWPEWVLQELISGCYEYSTSLLVHQGKILEVAPIRYEYDAEEYVWPRVKEIERKLVSVHLDHLALMSCFLEEYSGFCNFNYKMRGNGEIAFFEVNARVGADLACDVPRPRARAMFERLDTLEA